jgi:triacylglycerol esterase/lipase EstA (alpha/beta hydrolase family)
MLKHLRTTTIAIAAGTFFLAGCKDTASIPSGPLPVLKHDPVLFVHGYLGNNGNWQQMEDRFRADGWQDVELYAYNYSFIDSNASSAAEIRDQVDNIIQTTGATKVDIIAFSMGSVSSRYYLKNLGGAGKIDAWVSLAGPNHGTQDVENQKCSFTPCVEIIPGSSFLNALNAIDETPGLVRYATWRSPCDGTIIPGESVILSGATNNVAPCIAHIDFLTDPTVYAQVRAFID